MIRHFLIMFAIVAGGLFFLDWARDGSNHDYLPPQDVSTPTSPPNFTPNAEEFDAIVCGKGRKVLEKPHGNDVAEWAHWWCREGIVDGAAPPYP